MTLFNKVVYGKLFSRHCQAPRSCGDGQYYTRQSAQCIDLNSKFREILFWCYNRYAQIHGLISNL